MITRPQIEELFYGERNKERRFTQDFPILPDVWIAYGAKPHARLELLLTPHNRTDAATLANALRKRLSAEKSIANTGRSRWDAEHTKVPEKPRILFNESVVFVSFSFWELMRVAMPLSEWWAQNITPISQLYEHWDEGGLAEFATNLQTASRSSKGGDPRLLQKLIAIAGAIEFDRSRDADDSKALIEPMLGPQQATAFARLFAELSTPNENRGLLWNVSLNRPAGTSVWRSRVAIKADAAKRLFDIKTRNIRWAVLDTGIDATHPAFYRRDSHGSPLPPKPNDPDDQFEIPSRILKTYDFLRIKDLLDPDTDIITEGTAAGQKKPEEVTALRDELRQRLEHGKSIDWDLLEPFLRVPHMQGQYKPPTDAHGSHVAGIIAADWQETEKATPLKENLIGMCPDMELYDLRVLGKDSDEFTVIAALQFIRHLNSHKDVTAIQGVNLSMAVPHDVANFACGRTPVCEECERVVASGVVVVTAAGNRGFNKLRDPEPGSTGDYRFISITDPGNADGVITVGSTHRYMPHTYGVSYFSSRGPTGDGRTKPDLVAPGERIDSCSLDHDYETMDGTSMAAPHVSGAAALLMGRYRELIGQPKRIKEILCKSATDLGREPRFQGAGMLDVLRALQSV